MRILIVDDDSTFLDLLEMSLAENGFKEVVQASSADVVLEFLDNEDPYFDCFVLDIQTADRLSGETSRLCLE